MGEIPWGYGIPDWRRLAGSRQLVPGIQGVLLSLGVEELGYEGLPGLDWECCGLYSVRVNGGGLRADDPVGSLASLVAGMGSVDPWRCPLEIPGDTVDGVLVNPLGWRPITPILGGVGTSCIEAGGSRVSLISLEPLAAGPPSGCAKAGFHGQVSGVRLGGHIVEVEGGSWRYGMLEAVSGGDVFMAVHRGSASVRTGGGVRVRLSFYDYDVYMLYPLHYRLVGRVRRGDTLEVEAHSIYLRGPGGGLGFSSVEGVRATLGPGVVEVEAPRAAITLGSEVLAYRALVEQSVSWRPVRAPAGGLGHVRPGPGAPLLVGACGRELVFLLQNPSLSDGMFEARIRAPVEGVVVEGPLGSIDVPAPSGLFRVPTPRGYIGVARVRVGPGLLARLRMKSGGPGRFTQPV